MNREAPCAHPPRLAVWLVGLFAAENRAESIVGDLQEEFSDLASRLGITTARHWFWRQSVKTIAHSIGAAFRVAPWSLGAAVLFGFTLRWFGFGLPERVIVAILRAQRPYSNLHYDLYVWLVTWGIPIVGVIESTLIGCIAAAAARGREIVATATLSCVSAGSVALLLFVRTPPGWVDSAVLGPFLFEHFVNLLAIVGGGAVVRKIRSASSHWLSTP